MSRLCFCQERLDQTVLEVPPKLAFRGAATAWKAQAALMVGPGFAEAFIHRRGSFKLCGSFKNLSGILNNSPSARQRGGTPRKDVGKRGSSQKHLQPFASPAGTTAAATAGTGAEGDRPRTVWGRHSTEPAEGLSCPGPLALGRDHPTAPGHRWDGVTGDTACAAPCTACCRTALGLQTLLLLLIGFWGLFLILLISSGKAVF